MEAKALSFSLVTSIILPRTLEFIGPSCFSSCELVSVRFESDSCLREVCERAFENKCLKSIELPGSCEKLDGALSGLRSISFSYPSEFFTLDPPFVLTKDRKTLIHYFGRSKRLVIPKTVEVVGVGSVTHCEEFCRISFEEGSCLKRIARRAFAGADLTTISFPPTIEAIDEYAFTQCQYICEPGFPKDVFRRGVFFVYSM
jgi:hypothetical protein